MRLVVGAVATVLLTVASLIAAVILVGGLEGVAPIPDWAGSATGVAVLFVGLVLSGAAVGRVAPVWTTAAVVSGSALLAGGAMRLSAAAEGVEREGLEPELVLAAALTHTALVAAGSRWARRNSRPGPIVFPPGAAAVLLVVVALVAAVLRPVEAMAWEAGARLKQTTPAQRLGNGVDAEVSTHQWAAGQGISILAADGRSDLSSFLAQADPAAPLKNDAATGAPTSTTESYAWRLLLGARDADSVLYPQIRDHLHNYWTHRGRRYIAGQSAAGNAEKAFTEAMTNWRKGDRSAAMYWLGASLHLVQDACVPQHNWFGIGAYHHAYEVWVLQHQVQLSVTSGGIYRNDFRVNQGHGGEGWSSSHPRGWADECAHRAVAVTGPAAILCHGSQARTTRSGALESTSPTSNG